MLTEDEIKFIENWESNTQRRKTLMYQKVLLGFLWGFILGCATILPPFAVMKKQNLEITPGTLVIFIVCAILIGAFVGYFRWRMYFDKNEELYIQLKKKSP